MPGPQSGRVYPRVRGGAKRAAREPPYDRGLSPRSRGSRERGRYLADAIGSIPAFAGEPPRHRHQLGVDGVYPRVRGGATFSDFRKSLKAGLSPRSRGSRPLRLARLLRRGSIPAFAGEPRAQSQSVTSLTVYPRVRGGASIPQTDGLLVPGLSPRSRGSLMSGQYSAGQTGSIPALRGGAEGNISESLDARVYPRVRGGATLSSATKS